MIIKIIIFWLFFCQPALSAAYLFNYAIDADGNLIDLSGYSRDGDGNKPKRIKLRDLDTERSPRIEEQKDCEQDSESGDEQE